MGSISVGKLSKGYKSYPDRWGRLIEWILPFSNQRYRFKWVLQDIDFKVSPGEAVGIIGINGAGKSTLLKLITGTTQPTTGTVKLDGRVSALLELGMGFHPDFTGRQNVYMAGQLLGLSSDEINHLMPEIEQFAEIGDYIDQPIRVFSSGMQMRLAFSIATARRPDILIVDEALSVGDSYFQHKSFDRIRKFRDRGTTLLLVSHDSCAIQSICDRAILLNAGKLVMDGQPEEVMDYYNAMIAERENDTVRQQKHDSGKTETISGTGEATIAKAQLLNDQGECVEAINVGEKVSLKVVVDVHNDLPELVLGYMIKDRFGQPVFGTNTFHLNEPLSSLSTGEQIEYTFTFSANMGEGSYSVSLALHTQYTHVFANYEWRDLAIVFNVVNVGHERFIGVSWLPPVVNCQR